MENLYSSGGITSSTKTPKHKSLIGNVSPLNLNSQEFIGRGLFQQHHLRRSMSPIFDPYASSDSGSTSPNLDSPLIRYLRSSSSSGGGGFLSPMALASIENFETPPSRSPPVFMAPVRVEEDVLVMDGILVHSSSSKNPKDGGGGKMRSPLSSSDSGGRLTSSSSISSGGSESSLYKAAKCRFGEDSNTCRFGSKCQFAHGKEELRPSFSFSKNKLEAQICRSYSSGSCAYGTNCRFGHDQIKAGVPSMESFAESKILPAAAAAVSPITRKNEAGNSDTFTTFSSNIWCPLDDGIRVDLPSASNAKTPTKEDVNAHILEVLYGSSSRKRFPVFTEFCAQ